MPRAGIAGACLASPLAWAMLSPGFGGSALAGVPQSCDTSRYALSSPTSRFADNGDGTVTDRQSKLMWMRCAAGQTWSAGSCAGLAAALTWQGAIDAARSIDRGGSFFYSDWRLPQIPELAGIAERQCQNPRINLTVFPDTPAQAFWTATSRGNAGADTFAFTLSFGPDGVKYASKEEKHDVRFVRTAP